MAILAAQIDQVEAMLSLVTDKLARATLLAPFDGIVVSGDLHQLLGTPVELGKVLFQIAPLDAYRVILQVEERDIAHLKVGQQGELTLSGIPTRATWTSRSSRSRRCPPPRRAATISASRRTFTAPPSGCGPAWKASARSLRASAS